MTDGKMRGCRKHYVKAAPPFRKNVKNRCRCYECTGSYDRPFTRSQEKREWQEDIDNNMVTDLKHKKEQPYEQSE